MRICLKYIPCWSLLQSKRFLVLIPTRMLTNPASGLPWTIIFFYLMLKNWHTCQWDLIQITFCDNLLGVKLVLPWNEFHIYSLSTREHSNHGTCSIKIAWNWEDVTETQGINTGVTYIINNIFKRKRIHGHKLHGIFKRALDGRLKDLSFKKNIPFRNTENGFKNVIF